MIRRLVIILLFILACNISAFALDIPLPEDAKELKRKQLVIGPTVTDMVFLETGFSQPRLETFFRREFSRQGWSQIKELYFRKDNYFAKIAILATSKKTGKTKFIVNISSIPTKEQVAATMKDKPDEVSFLPTYPNASQLYLWDTSQGAMSSYLTPDNMDKVVFFYKSGMVRYGWRLEKETPAKTDFDNCPECKEKALKERMKKDNVKGLDSAQMAAAVSLGSASRTQLVFKNDKQDTCVIDIHERSYQANIVNQDKILTKETSAAFAPFIQEEKGPRSGSGSQIIVTYIEKKK